MKLFNSKLVVSIILMVFAAVLVGWSLQSSLALFSRAALLQANSEHVQRTTLDHSFNRNALNQKRDTDQDFKTAASKGCRLMAWMEELDDDKLSKDLLTYNITAASPWTDYASLATNGWERNPVGFYPGSLSFGPKGAAPVKAVVDYLGLNSTVYSSNDTTGDNEFVSWVVQAGWNANSSQYDNVYNTREGLVIFSYNRNPEGKRPALHSLSDVAALEYGHRCTEYKHDPTQLRYVIRTVSQTQATNDIVNSILQRGSNGSKTADYWTGRLELTPDTNGDDFNAIVGSPHGQGVAWMLIQHRQLFRTEADQEDFHIQGYSIPLSRAKLLV